ncbi:hypothetical protein PSTG_04698 [Puccinia striiformis f. sp. tritici PST-78]|uniref:Uncharacterized protein n=1 Tax=Puccinia striiformis f. sp. tritici PST-78 TaxID=1165861 RepID=A0A0L0VSF9_9BASI|nr:hypothetical protein PSTG_04698 [Puccinia striiformis f. sp. tritici PST-78]
MLVALQISGKELFKGCYITKSRANKSSGVPLSWKPVISLTRLPLTQIDLISAAIFPLVADFPALSRAAGFGGHQASLSCSSCLLDKKGLEEIDISNVPLRNNDLSPHASEWLKADSHPDKEALAKENAK